MMVFNEIDNFIEVYNNSVIELLQCFGTSFFGRIDHLASSVIKFRPKNSVPKHCIRSITYNYQHDHAPHQKTPGYVCQSGGSKIYISETIVFFQHTCQGGGGICSSTDTS